MNLQAALGVSDREIAAGEDLFKAEMELAKELSGKLHGGGYQIKKQPF